MTTMLKHDQMKRKVSSGKDLSFRGFQTPLFSLGLSLSLLSSGLVANQSLAQTNAPTPTTSTATSPATPAAPASKATAPTQPATIPIEFETLNEIKNMDPSAIIPGAYYYSNADDDPVAAPKVGTDGNIKYIEIASIKGDSSSVSSTQSYLTRWVQIPANAPERIKVSFKTKVTKNERFDWAAPGQSGVIRRKIGVSIDFIRPDGLEGGGMKLGSKALTKTLDKWANHSKVINIPKGAKHMKISLVTSGGYNLSLGDWTIE